MKEHSRFRTAAAALSETLPWLMILAPAAVPFLLTVTAWPEIVVPAYFLTKGAVLYDTVFFPHTPLLIGTVAVAGAVFGFSGVLFRFVPAIALLASAVLLVKRVARESILAAAAGVVVLLFGSVYFAGPAVWPDPLIAPIFLLAALILEAFEESDSRKMLLIAGVILGVAVLMKQTAAWGGVFVLAWLGIGRRGIRNLSVFAAAFVCPFLAFAILWGAAFQTTSHLYWTLLPITSKLGDEVAILPAWADMHEAIAPFLVLPAFFLLARASGSRILKAPLLMAAAGAAMSWPRTGLLHLAASAGVLALVASRATSAIVRLVRQWRRESPSLLRLSVAAAGIGLLLVSLGAQVWIGTGLMRDEWLGPVRYWDDPYTRRVAAAVTSRASPGGRIFLYNMFGRDTVYAITGTRTPEDLYVNSAFWYCLNKDRVDARVTASLRGFTGPMLMRDSEVPAPELKKTMLYRFMMERTETMASAGGDLVWRRIRPEVASPKEATAPRPSGGVPSLKFLE